LHAATLVVVHATLVVEKGKPSGKAVQKKAAKTFEIRLTGAAVKKDVQLQCVTPVSKATPRQRSRHTCAQLSVDPP
jgi:hypothetical protein